MRPTGVASNQWRGLLARRELPTAQLAWEGRPRIDGPCQQNQTVRSNGTLVDVAGSSRGLRARGVGAERSAQCASTGSASVHKAGAGFAFDNT